MRWKGICAGLAVGIAAGLALGAVRVRGDDDESELLMRQFFRPLTWLLRQIERYYVEDVDRSALRVGAYQGMIERADPGGLYLPAEMTERYGPGADGTIAELGLTARYLPVQKAVVIDGSIPGRAAFRAGLVTGDYVLKIKEAPDGKELETEGLSSYFDVVRALHGDEGTKVVLTVVRPRPAGQRQVELTRALAQTPSVLAADILDEEAGIGYAALTHFEERTVGQLFTTLTKLKQRGARGVILDLRFNPGGPLDSALMCADLLLDTGIMMGARRRGGNEETREAERGDAFPGTKLVLLVNTRTAEAAEVFAAALGDNGRASLVGQTTLGRGSKRSSVQCPYDGSTIRLAVARYLRPNGQEIERDREDPKKGGVAPDVEVSIAPEDVPRLVAGMARRLAGEAAEPRTEAQKQAEEPFADVQLQQAVEHMRSILAEEPVEEAAPVAVGAATEGGGE